MNEQKTTPNDDSNVTPAATPLKSEESSHDVVINNQEVTTVPEVVATVVDSTPSAGNSEPVSSQKNTVVRNYAIAGLIVVLMGGGLWLVLESQGRTQTNFLGSFAKSPAAVATVNGTKITREAYDKNRQQVLESARQQGVDVTDSAVIAEIDKQAIETLINTEILRQEANKLGVTVTPEDIQARYDTIVEQVGGLEALSNRMTELNLTEEGLRHDIEGELVIQALFAQAIDVSTVSVTEEEVKVVYEQVSAAQPDGAEPVAFADVREVIESNLRLSKEQELITKYIESLRTPADVEITL